MCYTEEQIEKYLEILNNYNKQAEEDVGKRIVCWDCQSDCFLLIQVIKFVTPVVRVTAMFWGIIIRKIMIDYIFERIVFIRESIIMRKRLIKFLKDYT